MQSELVALAPPHTCQTAVVASLLPHNFTSQGVSLVCGGRRPQLRCVPGCCSPICKPRAAKLCSFLPKVGVCTAGNCVKVWRSAHCGRKRFKRNNVESKGFLFHKCRCDMIQYWKELLLCEGKVLWNAEQLFPPEGQKSWHFENVALTKTRLGLKKTNTRTKPPLKIPIWQLFSALLGFRCEIQSAVPATEISWLLLFMGTDLSCSF